MYNKKYLSEIIRFLFIVISSALIISCSQTSGDVIGEGSLTVYTETDAETEGDTGGDTEEPSLMPDLAEISVNIREIIVVPEGDDEELISVIKFAEGEKIINLLDYLNGKEEISSAAVPAGRYSQVRVVLYGSGNYIKFAEEEKYDLFIPSGEQTGIKFDLSETLVIEDGSSWSMTISWDITENGFNINTVGAGDGYLMTPEIKVLIQQSDL